MKIKPTMLLEEFKLKHGQEVEKEIINKIKENYYDEDDEEFEPDEELKMYQMQVDQLMYDTNHEPTYDPEDGSK